MFAIKKKLIIESKTQNKITNVFNYFRIINTRINTTITDEET